jgi:hypothetical protein
MSRDYYTPPAAVPNDIEHREGYRSFWCCFDKGYTPAPFLLEQDETTGLVKVKFELNPFASTCQCQIVCTTQALVFDEAQPEDDLGSFCPADREYVVELSGQLFNANEPTVFAFNFIDAKGNSSSVTVPSLVTVIPQTPLGRVIQDGSILRHEIAVPLYSKSFYDLREIVTQYQVERYEGSPGNRTILYDWTNAGLWGTRERVHQIRGIRSGVPYGYRVRFRSSFDHASPWSSWLTLGT